MSCCAQLVRDYITLISLPVEDMSHAARGNGNVTVLSARRSLTPLFYSNTLSSSSPVVSNDLMSPALPRRWAGSRVPPLCAGPQHHQGRLSAWQRGGQLLQGTLSLQDWCHPGGRESRYEHTHTQKRTYYSLNTLRQYWVLTPTPSRPIWQQ